MGVRRKDIKALCSICTNKMRISRPDRNDMSNARLLGSRQSPGDSRSWGAMDGGVSANFRVGLSSRLHHRRSWTLLQRHHTRQHEAIRGLCRLIAVLRSTCSSTHRQPRDGASHHRPAPGPIAIPRDRACRRRDDSTHQHVWWTAAEAVRHRGRPCIQGTLAGLGRGRRPRRGNRWADTVRVIASQASQANSSCQSSSTTGQMPHWNLPFQAHRRRLRTTV